MSLPRDQKRLSLIGVINYVARVQHSAVQPDFDLF